MNIFDIEYNSSQFILQCLALPWGKTYGLQILSYFEICFHIEKLFLLEFYVSVAH